MNEEGEGREGKELNEQVFNGIVTLRVDRERYERLG